MKTRRRMTVMAVVASILPLTQFSSDNNVIAVRPAATAAVERLETPCEMIEGDNCVPEPGYICSNPAAEYIDAICIAGCR